MSAIAIPPSPRPASRVRTRGGVTGHLGGRAVARASRPRLLLVTDDFVPMAPTHGAADDAACHPMAAPAADSTELPMRRPSAPVALRSRRQELERLAPEHPAVRAARRRDRAQRDRGRQAVRQDAAVPSGNQQDRQGRTIRSQTESRLLRRGGSLAVIAVIALACCGFALGGLAGLASPTSAAAQPPVGTAATVTTVVRPGQSLWEIAAASGTADVSATVARIVELNDLQSTTVRAGQTLEVPVS